MSSRLFLILAVLLASGATFAPGLPPSLVLGSSFEAGSSSDLAVTSAVYTDARFQGSLGWRQALDGGGYFSIAGRGSIAPYVTTLTGFVDAELLNLELGLPVPGGTMVLDAGAQSSFVNGTGLGAWAEPALSAAWLLDRGAEGVQTSLGYEAGYLVEELGSDDHLSQALFVKLDQGASVQLGASATLRAGWELWTNEQAFDGVGAATGLPRQDWIVSITGAARGFAFYSVDWNAAATGGIRLSDAGIVSTGYSPLALPGGSRVNAALGAGLSWTPNRFMGLSLDCSVENDWYLDRLGINADGSTASSRLDVLAMGGHVKLDWTPDSALYFVLEAGAARSLANSPDQDLWSATVSLGVEYSF